METATLKLFLLLLLSALGIAAQAAEPETEVIPLAKQLAITPVALVDGKRCEIRGAVWANGPRAGVNVELTDASGKTTKVKTNAAGIYAASMPFSGKPISYQERIADEVWVRSEAVADAGAHYPVINCSLEKTRELLGPTATPMTRTHN